MELRHLRYFVAIAEERSFTRAAERLWVAQPGLSTQIRRLEAELGIQLFDRHTRGVDLTDVGERFLERARTALAAVENARSTGRDLQAGLVGSVRVGVATGARWGPVSSLLDGFGRARPDVEVTVVESHGGTLLRDLRDGRLDALVAPAMFGWTELRRVRLGWDPWVVLVGAGHRLARAGAIAAGELDGEQLVITGHRDGAEYDRAVGDLLAGLGVTPVLQRGGPGPALFAAVADGSAVALSTAAAAVGADVVVRRLEPTRRMAFELVWREETPAPAVREFIRAAQAGAKPARSRVQPAALAAVA